MIRQHSFHSQWWGQPVGIIDTGTFIGKDNAKVLGEGLRQYAWVEYRGQPTPKEALLLCELGFFCADTHIGFRLPMAKVEMTPSVKNLTVESALAAPFVIDPNTMQDFTHERFRFLPGVTKEKVGDRFIMWTQSLIQNSPALSFVIKKENQVCGWFLAEKPQGKRFQLTLAMLAKDPPISGAYLYRRAIVEYKRLGHRIGEASFSASNTPVLNIYADLGARFVTTTQYWLWLGNH